MGKNESNKKMGNQTVMRNTCPHTIIEAKIEKIFISRNELRKIIFISNEILNEICGYLEKVSL